MRKGLGCITMVVILSKNVLIFIKFIIQGRFKNQDAEDGQNFSP